MVAQGRSNVVLNGGDFMSEVVRGITVGHTTRTHVQLKYMAFVP